MPWRQLMIIGAGGHGKVIRDIAKKTGYKEIYFLDDVVTEKENYKGKVFEFKRYIDTADFFIAIGNNEKKKKIQSEIAACGGVFVNMIHPRAVIAEDVKLGVGISVMAGAVINSGTKIGNGVIINTLSSVDHDCLIEDFVHIAVGAHIAGNVKIGENTFIGAGATVINNVSVCGDCIIGAGGVVVRNLNKSGIYKGVPVK